MSQKINPCDIVSRHLSTLKNVGCESFSAVDLGVFFGLPILIAIVLAIVGVDLEKKVVDVFVTAGAIFTGLLLNLLLLVYDNKSRLDPVDQKKIGYQKVQLKHKILEELYYNISFSTLVAVILILVSIIHLSASDLLIPIVFPPLEIDYKFDFSLYMTSPILVMVGMNLMLTIIMIVRRIHNLLVS